MANHRLYPFWGHLTEALRTGQPQNEVKAGDPGDIRDALRRPGAPEGIPQGDDRHQSWRQHDDRAGLPLEGLRARSWTWERRRAIWPSRSRLRTPICAASGSTCRRWSRFSTEYVAAIGVSDRVSFTPGSFFERDLPKADVIMMGHILHDWDLPTKKMLIEKAFDALPAGGAFIVYDVDHRR